MPRIGGFGGSKHMAREHLEDRDPWQADASIRGTEAEKAFWRTFTQHLSETDLQVLRKPKDLSGIYGSGYGICPDFSIYCERTRESIYVEVKRQNASGNAHERACRYMMPGILYSARKCANQSDDVIPIWWIFSDEIASTPVYRRKIMHWFRGVEGHVLLWEDIEDSTALVNHFEQHIRCLLV